MVSDTFPVSRTPNPLQFIPYHGPPKPKQFSRHYPRKDEYPNIDEIPGIGHRSNMQLKDRGNITHALHGPEVIDLTSLDCELDSPIGGGGGGGSDVGSGDGFTQDKGRCGGFEQSVLMRASPEDVGDESSNQPAPFEGSDQETAVAIEDSQSEWDIDKVYPPEDEIGTQIGDESVVSSVSTPKRPMSPEDAINLTGTQASGPPCRELRSILPTGSLMTHMEGSTQEASYHTVLKVTAHQPQRLMQKKAERQRTFSSAENASSSSSRAGVINDGNHTTRPVRKRKRSSSKQRSKHCAHPNCSRRHKQERNHGGADEDDEYEVEKILDARINRKKLQYRVKWLGYEDDREWYNASNFKNSPYKLGDFHTTNPTRPGPPKSLERWVEYWEEDRDADDPPDDNKPERLYT